VRAVHPREQRSVERIRGDARRRGTGSLAMGLLFAGAAVGLGGVAFCFDALYLPRASL